MTIDHIFIFTNDFGKITDELVEFGLSEGSGRIHIGQGTTNRKFYFDNFFLEILWVHDEKEINSERIKPIGLGQRADFISNDFSPFGLCLANEENNDELFENAYKYQPQYFSEGMTIDILKNEHNRELPFTFRLLFKEKNMNLNEPKNHSVGIKILSKATFYCKKITDSDYIKKFQPYEHIEFIESNENWLKLTFNNNQHGEQKKFEKLKLTIEY